MMKEIRFIAGLGFVGLVLVLLFGFFAMRESNLESLSDEFGKARAIWLADNCRAAQFQGASNRYIDVALAKEIGIDSHESAAENLRRVRRFMNGKGPAPHDGSVCERGNVRCIYGPGNGIFAGSDWFCAKMKRYGE